MSQLKKNYVKFFIYFTDFETKLVHFHSIQNILTFLIFLFILQIDPCPSRTTLKSIVSNYSSSLMVFQNEEGKEFISFKA